MKNLNLFSAFLFSVLLIPGLASADEETLEMQEAELGFEIVSISGSVEVLPSGEEEYQEAEEDAFLQVGDKICTGVDAYAELAYDEEGSNVIQVGSDTSCLFTLEESEKIELLEGEIFATISELPAGSSFEIRTPTAVSGTRGTDWATKVDKDGTKIEALDGNPYAKGFKKDGSLMREATVLQPGHMTRVRRFQGPSAPVRFSKERGARLGALKNEVRVRAKNVIQRRKTQPGRQFRRDRMRHSLKKRMADKPQLKPAPKGGKPGGNKGKLTKRNLKKRIQKRAKKKPRGRQPHKSGGSCN